MASNLYATGWDQWGVMGKRTMLSFYPDYEMTPLANQAEFQPTLDIDNRREFQVVSAKHNHVLAISDHYLYSWGNCLTTIPHTEMLDPEKEYYVGSLGRRPDANIKMIPLDYAIPRHMSVWQDPERSKNPVWQMASAGLYHSIALTLDGHVYGCGLTEFYAGGFVSPPIQYNLLLIQVLGQGCKFIATGHEHSFAITNDGRLRAWGRNHCGQLGIDTEEDRVPPAGGYLLVVGSPGEQWADWMMAAGGRGHSIGIRRDNTLWAWGANDKGQLGLGDLADRKYPTQVVGDSDALIDRQWLTVDCGPDYTAAICKSADGKSNELWVWGDNSSGVLGNGTKNDASVPIQVTAEEPTLANTNGWLEVSAGHEHVLAIRKEYNRRSLYAWGQNDIPIDDNDLIRSRFGLGEDSAAEYLTPQFIRREA